MTTETPSSSIPDIESATKFTEFQESELAVSLNEENNDKVPNKQEEFYLDSSLIDKSIINKIGIEKSTNSLIVEACNQVITQTINIADFSNKTIKPLKKQLSEIFAGYKNKEERQKLINCIITCINNNITKIFEYYKERSSLSKSRLITSSSSAAEEEGEENNKADVLIDLASSPENVEKFFKDQNRRIFAAIRLGRDRSLEILDIDSTKYKRYLAKLYRENRGSCINDSLINTVVTNLASEAEFNGDIIPLHLKVAWGSEENRAKKNCIYYDMCDKQGRIIEISKDSWKIIDGSDKDVPILFKKFNQQLQVQPDRNYDEDIFEKLVDLTNVRKKDNRQLLKVYIISTLIPEIDHAMLTTYGPKGSAKSFLLELIKKLVDPTKPLLLTLQRNVDQFIQQVDHNYINYYDNVKFIPYWLSEEICKSVTGTGHTKRVHYTNDDDFVYEHRRCLGLNEINVALTKPDVLDRSISMELEDIDEDKRRKEADLWSEFEKIKPQAFAYILDVIVRAMKIKETLNLKKLPRLADFAEWGEAISQAMNYLPMSFMEIYKENRNEQNIVAVSENLASSILLKYVLDIEKEEGTLRKIEFEPQQLFKALIDYAQYKEIKIDSRHFPKDAASLVKKIKTVIPNFKAGYGINIDIGRSQDNTSTITIYRKSTSIATEISKKCDDSLYTSPLYQHSYASQVLKNKLVISSIYYHYKDQEKSPQDDKTLVPENDCNMHIDATRGTEPSEANCSKSILNKDQNFDVKRRSNYENENNTKHIASMHNISDI